MRPHQGGRNRGRQVRRSPAPRLPGTPPTPDDRNLGRPLRRSGDNHMQRGLNKLGLTEIRIAGFGGQGEVVANGRKFNNSMPKFPLGDDDIANVLTFVYNSFGNAGMEVQPDEVKVLRTQPPDAEGPKVIPQKSEFE